MAATAKCHACNKTVYRMDPQINLDGVVFHKPCAKCEECQCQITLANFTKDYAKEKKITLLCKTHYASKRNREGGSTYMGVERVAVKPTGSDTDKRPDSINLTGRRSSAGSSAFSPAKTTSSDGQTDNASRSTD